VTKWINENLDQFVELKRLQRDLDLEPEEESE
jgi:hypothetical protein